MTRKRFNKGFIPQIWRFRWKKKRKKKSKETFKKFESAKGITQTIIYVLKVLHVHAFMCTTTHKRKNFKFSQLTCIQTAVTHNFLNFNNCWFLSFSYLCPYFLDEFRKKKKQKSFFFFAEQLQKNLLKKIYFVHFKKLNIMLVCMYVRVWKNNGLYVRALCKD